MRVCRHLKTLSSVWALVLLVLAPLSTEAEKSQSSSKIAFLRLQADSSGFKLLEATIVDGSLKSPRGELLLEEYSYELVGIDSTILFQGSFENPLTGRFEYEDPDNPGQILAKIVELPDSELTIRVPVTTAMHRLNIYRIEQVSILGIVQPQKRAVISIPVGSIATGADK